MSAFHSKFQHRAPRATVYQLRADVLCPNGMDDSFSRMIGLILPFVTEALDVELPPEAEEHRSFEISDDGCRCECIAVPERTLWALRADFTDKAGLTWHYDISLVRDDDRLLFGMKIDTAAGADVKAMQANLPLVDALVGSGLLAQKRPVSRKTCSSSTLRRMSGNWWSFWKTVAGPCR